MAQFNIIWVIENLITITKDLFDDIQRLINCHVPKYLDISSVIHRYNRFNCILYECVTDNHRYMILEIFEYHNIALPDTIALNELWHWEFPLFLLLFYWTIYDSCRKKNWHAKFSYANLAHDFQFFFVSYFEGDLIEHNFFERE